MPDSESLLTGPEYVERVLLPLAARAPLRGRVRTQHRVVAIGRRGLTREDYAGHPLRSERPFRLLVSVEDGGAIREEIFEAEVVLDASGGFILPRELGSGGLPAKGESTLLRSPIRTLGQLDAVSEELAGQRILIVGSGHSAANAILVLEGVAAKNAATRVTWAVRTPNRRPCEDVANDPLPERARVVRRANELAATPPPFLTMERRAMVEEVAETGRGTLVTLTGQRTVEVDRIVALTGYRPDGHFLTELTVEISPVTEGGSRLYRAISGVTDCLSVPAAAPSDLASGEPGFYFVGSRAFGRSNAFLLQTGLSQLETILDQIS